MNPEVKKIFVLFKPGRPLVLGRSEGRGRLAGEIRRRNRYVQV